MFLAWKEIKHDKLRYGLIILMIVLISYLIFILTSLANGLASQNTQAINSWNPTHIVLNQDSNTNIAQSRITQQQLDNVKLDSQKSAIIGTSATVVTANKRSKLSGQFVGLNPKEYIYQDLQLVSGHKVNGDHQVVADTKFQQNGYKLGDEVQLNSSTDTYKIVGFTKNAKLNLAPIMYGTNADWHTISNLNETFAGNAIISKQSQLNGLPKQLHAYATNTVVQKLPGYSAQTLTFSFMIGFLMVISLIIIAVFLYILTMQKLQNYAVLRAQGIPASFLVKATLFQSLLLVAIGIVVSLVVTAGTLAALPAAVPIQFSLPIIGMTVIGLLATSLLGALIPVLLIMKINPAEAIGG
ncbi:FtsX-like permease family protein [Fructilactobacillus vespulae]|uniref:ABC transporter permease n=1 Tax=Fructilactobacillus vespulae TaxID=1249630 RepID=UPI0039B420CA